MAMPDIDNFAYGRTASGDLNNSTSPITITLTDHTLPAYVNGYEVVIYDDVTYSTATAANAAGKLETASVTAVAGDNVTLTRSSPQAFTGTPIVARHLMKSDITAVWSGMPMAIISETIVGAGGSASVTFSSIPATYRHLLLNILARGDNAANLVGCKFQLNDDSGSNYVRQYHGGRGSTQVIGQDASNTSVDVGDIPAASADAGYPCSCHVKIPYYAATTFHKLIWSFMVTALPAASGGLSIYDIGHQWKSASAINKIYIFPASDKFIEGSRFTLYGIL